jgi:hypothetical protein
MTTTEAVAVKALNGGKVHAGERSANGAWWVSTCSGRMIGGDYAVITETVSHVNCSRCLAKLGRAELH